jgi:hypothetical protein
VGYLGFHNDLYECELMKKRGQLSNTFSVISAAAKELYFLGSNCTNIIETATTKDNIDAGCLRVYM